MVQIIHEGDTFGQSLGQALGALGGNYFGGQMAEQRQKRLMQQQQMQKIGEEQRQQSNLQQALSEAQKVYADPNLSPEQKQIGLFRALSGRPEVAASLSKNLGQITKGAQQSEQKALEDKKTYDTVSKAFGPEFADLYGRATEGGKTKLIQAGLEAKERGIDLRQILGMVENDLQQNQELQQPQQMQEQQVPQDIEEGVSEQPTPVERPKVVQRKQDFDKGLRPAERARRQENRYSKNLPLWQESSKKLDALEKEKDNISILKDLQKSGKTLGPLGRLNVNPKTGDLVIPALASPEGQRFVKTINDFTTLAKDSYGARVTNFDLQQFMRRLPTLANTEEGRNQIIDQLEIINDLNILNTRATRDVIDEYGGLRNIDYDRAEKLAEKSTKQQKEKLKQKFSKIGQKADKAYENDIEELRKEVPDGYILVEKDGEFGHIPKADLKTAIEEGYRKL